MPENRTSNWGADRVYCNRNAAQGKICAAYGDPVPGGKCALRGYSLHAQRLLVSECAFFPGPGGVATTRYCSLRITEPASQWKWPCGTSSNSTRSESATSAASARITKTALAMTRRRSCLSCATAWAARPPVNWPAAQRCANWCDASRRRRAPCRWRSIYTIPSFRRIARCTRWLREALN